MSVIMVTLIPPENQGRIRKAPKQPKKRRDEETSVRHASLQHSRSSSSLTPLIDLTTSTASKYDRRASEGTLHDTPTSASGLPNPDSSRQPRLHPDLMDLDILNNDVFSSSVLAKADFVGGFRIPSPVEQVTTLEIQLSASGTSERGQHEPTHTAQRRRLPPPPTISHRPASEPLLQLYQASPILPSPGEHGPVSRDSLPTSLPSTRSLPPIPGRPAPPVSSPVTVMNAISAPIVSPPQPRTIAPLSIITSLSTSAAAAAAAPAPADLSPEELLARAPVLGTGGRPLPRPPTPPFTDTSGEHLGFLEFTDLDILLSRIDDNGNGNYEDLLAMGEVLGPALAPPPRPALPILPTALVAVERRRVTKEGKVKLKMSVMGISVDRCGVCLSQFKAENVAVLLPCNHCFHDACVRPWFTQSRSCPLCRSVVM